LIGPRTGPARRARDRAHPRSSGRAEPVSAFRPYGQISGICRRAHREQPGTLGPNIGYPVGPIRISAGPKTGGRPPGHGQAPSYYAPPIRCAGQDVAVTSEKNTLGGRLVAANQAWARNSSRWRVWLAICLFLSSRRRCRRATGPGASRSMSASLKCVGGSSETGRPPVSMAWSTGVSRVGERG